MRRRRAGIAPVVILIPILMMAMMIPVAMTGLAGLLGLMGLSSGGPAPKPRMPSGTIEVEIGADALSQGPTEYTTQVPLSAPASPDTTAPAQRVKIPDQTAERGGV